MPSSQTSRTRRRVAGAAALWLTEAPRARRPSVPCSPIGRAADPLGHRRRGRGKAPSTSRAIARSCGRWIHRLSTSRCGLPHCSRTETRPRGTPSSPSGRSRPAPRCPSGSATCPSRTGAPPPPRRARAPARGRRTAASRRRPARRSGSSAAMTSACVAVGVATTTPSTSPSASRSPTTRSAPPSVARAMLAAERATTGTVQPSALRSRRMCRPQPPQPTSPIVDTRADPSGARVATISRDGSAALKRGRAADPRAIRARRRRRAARPGGSPDGRRGGRPPFDGHRGRGLLAAGLARRSPRDLSPRS